MSPITSGKSSRKRNGMLRRGWITFLLATNSSSQGRFTSIDPENYQARLDPTDPQSWNAYSYVNNNPLARVDPDGRGFFTKLKNKIFWGVWGEEADVQREENKRRQMLLNVQQENGGELIIENLGGNLVRVDPANMTRLQVFFWSNRLMDIWEQGGGSRPLSPEELAGVVNSTRWGRQIGVHRDVCRRKNILKIIGTEELLRILRPPSNTTSRNTARVCLKLSTHSAPLEHSMTHRLCGLPLGISEAVL